MFICDKLPRQLAGRSWAEGTGNTIPDAPKIVEQIFNYEFTFGTRIHMYFFEYFLFCI